MGDMLKLQFIRMQVVAGKPVDTAPFGSYIQVTAMLTDAHDGIAAERGGTVAFALMQVKTFFVQYQQTCGRGGKDGIGGGSAGKEWEIVKDDFFVLLAKRRAK